MQGLRFLRNKFYFSQRFKHALPIIDKKIGREICKACAFCMKNFSFYSVLNTLYQSLIENSRVKDARSLLFMQRISLFKVFLKSSLSKFSHLKDARSSLYARI